MENLIYKTGKKYLGKDISKTENELGCAEAVNFVCKEAIGQEAGGGLSTTKMYQSLLTDTRFKRVNTPEKGDIIISPTGYGQGYGHTGIVSDSGKIMSNNSFSYLWDEHITLGEWWLKYKTFPIALFRYKEPAIIKKDLEQKKISILMKIVALYQQIIKLKLGSMTNSKMFRLNYRDILNGVIVAVLSAVFLKVNSALNTPGFSFTSYDWASLLQVATSSAFGFIATKFFTDSKGTPLGRADKK